MGCSASSDSQVKKDFHENYKLADKLGSGAFGCVYKAHLRDRCHPNYRMSYAAKILDKQAPNGPSASSVRKDFRLEVDMLSKIKESKNVIGLIDAFEDTRFCYVVMECCGPTVLEAFLEQADVNETELAQVFYGMTKGVMHCHSANIVHRDIKPQNFLISHQGARLGDRDCTIKLCDMGFAIELAPKGLKELCGTPPFMAPEMLQQKMPYDLKVDVWSLGVSMYLMLFGTFPYNPEKPCGETMKKLIREGKTKPSFKATDGLEQPSSHACEFCQMLLERNPIKRKTADQVLAMPYMQDCSIEERPAPSAAEPESATKEFFRKRSRMHSLGGNIAKAAQRAKESQYQRGISRKALEIFEKELQKLQEITGQKRPSSNRTMTLPSTHSGSTKHFDFDEEDDTTYATVTSPKSPGDSREEIVEPIGQSFSRTKSLESQGSRLGQKRHHTHDGAINHENKVVTEEGKLLTELRTKAVNA